MENHDCFDDELTKLVRSVERDVPADVERKLQAAAEAARSVPRKRRLRRRLLVLASLSGAAAVLLAILFIIPLFRHREPVQIAEIRTEFEIADKNIKIIFVQKPDFPVLVTAF